MARLRDPALLAGGLAVNLWVVAVGVPLLLGRGPAPGGRAFAAALCALLAPGALVLGAVWRSQALLLVGYPLLVLAPRGLLGAALERPPWLVELASLIGYVLAATWALRPPLPRAEVRALPAEATPERWRRRLRIYHGLAAVAAAFPLTLILWINTGERAEAIARNFGARAQAAQALLTVLAGLLSLGIYRVHLLEPLRGHLQQDRAVWRMVEDARAQARKGRPRPRFYFFVAGALAAMAAVVWLKTR